MKGVNVVIISGNVGERINFGKTGANTLACSFSIASDAAPIPAATWVRICAYGEDLVQVCRTYLKKGVYVLVEGELMNRTGKFGELTEVRARRVVFHGLGSTEDLDGDDTEGRNGGSESVVTEDPETCQGVSARP